MQQADQPFAVGVQKAEVAGPPEALGQDMPEDQPKELNTGQRASPHLSALAVLITKGYLAVPAGDNVLFLDDAFIQIAPQINQRLVAAANGLDVDDPGFGIPVRQIKSCLRDRL